MKKILIVNNNLHLGGVQKALVNLLSELAAEPSVEVTLLLFHPGGVLSDQVPENVRVITPSVPFRCWGLTRLDKAGWPLRAMRSLFAACTRVFGRKRTLLLAYPFQKKLKGYDAAISYLHSGRQNVFYGGCNEFVLHCVEAEKKIAFLHCDYEMIGANSPENTAVYSAFDRIAACSEGCRGAFLRVLPQMESRTVVVPNCLDYGALSAQKTANLTVQSPLRIITVARFGKEKGVLRAIRAARALKDRADHFRYEIIGDGVEFAEAKKLVCTSGLVNTVLLYGERPNPYPLMRQSDVLLIPSVSEAAPLVIGEAAALGIPIMTTETSSAREMVEKTGVGWVCENSEEGVRQGIEWLLDHPEEIEQKKQFLCAIPHDNHVALRRFMELIS